MDQPDTPTHLDSEFVARLPDGWRASAGDQLPNGGPATYRSSIHALMALRAAYRFEVLGEGGDAIQEWIERYDEGWNRYVELCSALARIVQLLDAGDQDWFEAWNRIDQPASDSAWRVVMVERESHGNRSLRGLIGQYFGFEANAKQLVIPRSQQARPVRTSDSEAAWQRSSTCAGCGILTISATQHRRLNSALKTTAPADTSPTFITTTGKVAPIWPELTLAAKGVAEHVVPRSHGGPTAPSNLTNACSGCNYSRMDWSMDEIGASRYARPASEIGTPDRRDP